jgi:hypothetical protein
MGAATGTASIFFSPAWIALVENPAFLGSIKYHFALSAI